MTVAKSEDGNEKGPTHEICRLSFTPESGETARAPVGINAQATLLWKRIVESVTIWGLRGFRGSACVRPRREYRLPAVAAGGRRVIGLSPKGAIS